MQKGLHWVAVTFAAINFHRWLCTKWLVYVNQSTVENHSNTCSECCNMRNTNSWWAISNSSMQIGELMELIWISWVVCNYAAGLDFVAGLRIRWFSVVGVTTKRLTHQRFSVSLANKQLAIVRWISQSGFVYDQTFPINSTLWWPLQYAMVWWCLDDGFTYLAPWSLEPLNSYWQWQGHPAWS